MAINFRDSFSRNKLIPSIIILVLIAFYSLVSPTLINAGAWWVVLLLALFFGFMVIKISINFFRKVSISKDGTIITPNWWNGRIKYQLLAKDGKEGLPKNYFVIKQNFSSGDVFSKPDFQFCFEIANIKNIYLVSESSEKEKLSKIIRSSMSRRVAMVNPSFYLTDNENKSICLEFDSPLGFIDEQGNFSDRIDAVKKIYLSIGNPKKLRSYIISLNKKLR